MGGMKGEEEERRDGKKEGNKGGISKIMVVLISFTMQIISPCICISRHQVVHLNNTSSICQVYLNKTEKNKEKRRKRCLTF